MNNMNIILCTGQSVQDSASWWQCLDIRCVKRVLHLRISLTLPLVPVQH